MYPKIVYHKDYSKAVGEKEREEKSQKVHSEADLKRLGSDWGDHPASKKVKAEISRPIVEESEERPFIKSKKVKGE